MRPGTVKRRPHVDRALASGFDPSAGRFEQHGDVAGHELRLLLEQVAQAVVLVGDLFAFVEHERHVARGAARLGRGRQLHQDREAALHVSAAEPVQHVAVAARLLIAVGRDRVEVPAEHDALVSRQGTAHDDVLRNARALERRCVLATPAFDEVGERGFVPLDRRDRAQLLGQL